MCWCGGAGSGGVGFRTHFKVVVNQYRDGIKNPLPAMCTWSWVPVTNQTYIIEYCRIGLKIK